MFCTLLQLLFCLVFFWSFLLNVSRSSVCFLSCNHKGNVLSKSPAEGCSDHTGLSCSNGNLRPGGCLLGILGDQIVSDLSDSDQRDYSDVSVYVRAYVCSCRQWSSFQKEGRSHIYKSIPCATQKPTQTFPCGCPAPYTFSRSQRQDRPSEQPEGSSHRGQTSDRLHSVTSSHVQP